MEELVASGSIPLKIPESINFPVEEEKILKYWNEIQAFETSMEQARDRPKYIFFDGPPFATGLPHYGHILAGTIKDAVTRYAHQSGYHVERHFGWDCHGLPVEYEIDKEYGIKTHDDVQKMGIDVYNAKCRGIVTRYIKEWEKIMGRLGRWIDFKNDYKTMYPWYMESVWWIFKQLYNKGLVYQGNRVMPYSNTCGTPFSNFEAGQNFKEVIDPAIIVSFPLIDYEIDASLLIWTTTPWTLPSNLAACVNPQFTYALFQQVSTRKHYIMLKERIDVYFLKSDFVLVKDILGLNLKGARYTPVFTYYEHLRSTGAFTVLVDEYVTSDIGTGIVHQAPYFGEDDYRICLKNGIITTEQEPICPLDASGRFLPPVHDFLLTPIKDADREIIKYLAAHDRLVDQSQFKHNYPFCWRSDTPLIYRSVRSWFIRVEHMRELLVKIISQTHWVPEYVRDKRFGNWLLEARDWSVSRNRYWGTPIPIWMSDREVRCVGSIAELSSLTGHTIQDIHRDSIDDLIIQSEIPGNPPLRRIPEVFDCWFESGCMPYAQLHYPFENGSLLDSMFPADFISEGIDQTRGWFYTLLVISTALLNIPPYKNVIACGLILAADGQKMSKRKKNYPDPMFIVNKYGADALRLYLINSPVVRAENLHFKEEGVKEVIKDVLLPWYNAFRFLMQNIKLFNKEYYTFVYNRRNSQNTTVMDRWIISVVQSLLKHLHQGMHQYHLYSVVPNLTKFINYLTNCYIRMNRGRIKGEETSEDAYAALNTLFDAIYTLIKMMSPFTPFFSENMYLQLKHLTDSTADSVHHLFIPTHDDNLIDKKIERSVARMQTIIDLGRVIRDQKNISLRYPLGELVVLHEDKEFLQDIASMREYILKELNVYNLTATNDKEKYGIRFKVEPNYKVLGARFKKSFKDIVAAINKLTENETKHFLKRKFMYVFNSKVEINEVRLVMCADAIDKKYAVNNDNETMILLDTSQNCEMIDQGIARDICNRVQKLRKKAQLVPTDEVIVYYEADGEIERVCEEYLDFIQTSIKINFKKISEKERNDHSIIEEVITLKSSSLVLNICKEGTVDVPLVRWANLQAIDLKPKLGATSNKGMVLLEAAGISISLEMLKKSIYTLFGLENYDLKTKSKLVLSNNDLNEVNAETIFIVPQGRKPKLPKSENRPFCKIHNFNKNNVHGTIIMENPKGSKILSDKKRDQFIEQWSIEKVLNNYMY